MADTSYEAVRNASDGHALFLLWVPLAPFSVALRQGAEYIWVSDQPGFVSQTPVRIPLSLTSALHSSEVSTPFLVPFYLSRYISPPCPSFLAT